LLHGRNKFLQGAYTSFSCHENGTLNRAWQEAMPLKPTAGNQKNPFIHSYVLKLKTNLVYNINYFTFVLPK